ncbi:MAG TPA: hypothetical protein VNH18_04580 [Bryobacteraceae bacterium]|nr:hypothetical protein [Bryobacteraceae bacterium]
MEQTTSDHEFLHGRGDLNSAAVAIRSIEWGADELLPHPILSQDDLRSVLKRALAGEVPLSAVEAWAEAIEGRTDLVEYENQAIADTLFEIATPEINGDLTSGRLEEL